MSDEEGGKVSLEWVPRHKSITGNEMVDIEAKTALDDVRSITRLDQMAHHQC
jgi:ribonuclease HI